MDPMDPRPPVVGQDESLSEPTLAHSQSYQRMRSRIMPTPEMEGLPNKVCQRYTIGLVLTVYYHYSRKKLLHETELNLYIVMSLLLSHVVLCFVHILLTHFFFSLLMKLRSKPENFHTR